VSATASRGLLTLATRQVQARWSETRNSWRDSKAADFEELYLADLAQCVNTALSVLEELEHLLERIHADCE
jgi:hypothetical protein